MFYFVCMIWGQGGGGGVFFGILYVILKFEILIFSERGVGFLKFCIRFKYIWYL